MKKLILTTLMIAIFTTMAFSQISATKERNSVKETVPSCKFSFGTTWLNFMNFGEEKTNTHHYEFHFRYQITPKDRIGIKVATWKMFAPMGMPIPEQLKYDENNFYPGRLRESGIGFTYQRMLWKGLFATVEVLPQLKKYIDSNDAKIGSGFKLYSSYHLGYHVPLFKNRLYIEPQVHFNYWPIDSEGPQGFEEKEAKWNNFILFEPNMYIGINF